MALSYDERKKTYLVERRLDVVFTVVGTSHAEARAKANEIEYNMSEGCTKIVHSRSVGSKVDEIWLEEYNNEAQALELQRELDTQVAVMFTNVAIAKLRED